MKGVTFDGQHSYSVFRLLLNSYEIGEAEPNYMLVEVPGANGVLDYSDYFGGITYKNRELKFSFTFWCSRMELNAAYKTLQSKLHGKNCKIILDDDKGSYYIGRVSVGSLVPDGQIGTVELTANCDPFQYARKTNEASVSGETRQNGSDGENDFDAITIEITNNGGAPMIPSFNGNTPYYITFVTKEETSFGNVITYRYLNGHDPVPIGQQDLIPGAEVPPGETRTFGFFAEKAGDTFGMLTVQAKWQERSL